MVKMGGNTKGPKQVLVQVVWSQPSRRQYSVEMKDQVYQEMWMVEWPLWASPRQSSLQRVLLANASFADLKAFHVAPSKDLRRKRKIWRLLKNLYSIRDTSQVFATYVEEGPNEHGLQKDAVVPCWYWKATLKTCGVYWGDCFIPAFSDDRANDLEQLMREAFKVKICEHVDPGFLTTVKFLHRKVAWNAEDPSWFYDPKYTLVMADEFSFDGQKQLEQRKSILVAPGSKTVNKGLHDVQTSWTNEKRNSAGLWLAQH